MSSNPKDNEIETHHLADSDLDSVSGGDFGPVDGSDLYNEDVFFVPEDQFPSGLPQSQ